MSTGWVNNIKVNLHHLDDRERLQLITWVKHVTLQYMVLTNQNLQIDPITHNLRLLAKLSLPGDPVYIAIRTVIDELHAQIQAQTLTAKLMFMLVKPFLVIEQEPKLMTLLEEFFQMLIVNNLFNTKIGPPFSLVGTNGLKNENVVWNTAIELQRATRNFMTTTIPAKKKAKVHWKAGKNSNAIQVIILSIIHFRKSMVHSQYVTQIGNKFH